MSTNEIIHKGNESFIRLNHPMHVGIDSEAMTQDEKIKVLEEIAPFATRLYDAASEVTIPLVQYDDHDEEHTRFLKTLDMALHAFVGSKVLGPGADIYYTAHVTA